MKATRTPERIELGKRLRSRRIASSLSQVEAAERAKVADEKIRDLERGERILTVETAEALARVYGVAPALLVGWEKESSAK